MPTLVELAEWVRKGKAPILSLLISRDGKLVFSLYTSGLSGDEAHYVMSVTKSVTSLLVGILADQKQVDLDASLSDSIPAALFPSPAAREKLRPITMHHVLGMSALDALVPPHQNTTEATVRGIEFWNAPNRFRFALGQRPLPKPGTSFQYTDITPLIASGVLSYKTGMPAQEFGDKHVFGPLGWKNHEWMHQDPAGIDNGAYGLRIRPIDMQKFGLLYLQQGQWEGKQIVSKEWVKRSLTPWIRTHPTLSAPNYGAYFWTANYGKGFFAHLANGWKGQRIAIVPEQRIVVSMTAIIEDGSEERVFTDVMKNYVVPSVQRGGAADPSARAALERALLAANGGASRIPVAAEGRMIPTLERKEVRLPFRP